MARHPKSTKFAKLSQAEKARRISQIDDPTKRAAARRFWNVPDKDATIWAAEQNLAPWEVDRPKLPPVPIVQRPGWKPPPPPPQTAKRYEWAKRSLVDQKARQKLANSLTPQRRQQLLRANVLANATPIPEKPAGLLDLLPKRSELADIVRPELGFSGFRGVGNYLGRQAHDFKKFMQPTFDEVSGLMNTVYDMALTPEQQDETEAWLQMVIEQNQGHADKIAKVINHALAGESGHLEQAGIPVPDWLKKTAKATVASGVHEAVGLGPGLVQQAIHPVRSLEQMGQQYKDYYTPMLHGDFSQIEEQGVLQPAFDILSILTLGATGAGRAAAVSRTRQFLKEGGELRHSSEGRPFTSAEAQARALTMGQEPVQIIGTDVYTMGRPTPIRDVLRDAQVRKGETINEGDAVVIRVGDEEHAVPATKENGLAGIEAPDVNNPIRVKLDGQDVDVYGAYRQMPFAQRLIPRSAVGRAISDIWANVRNSGESRNRLDLRPGGARYRASALRKESEVSNERAFGALRAFKAEHRKIQKDPALAHAYDRMLRYPDPLEGIDAEIANRTQRGMTESKEQLAVLRNLREAREHVANPSPELRAAVEAGRALSNETTAFLVRRGFLSQEQADRAQLAAARWNRPGHLLDEPLDSPERSIIEDSLRDHFDGDEELTRLAMAYTDDLARAEAARTGGAPEDWYENIASVESVPEERLREVARQDPNVLRQERYFKRTPNVGSLLPYRDGNTIRVARVVEVGWDGERLGAEIAKQEERIAQARETYRNAEQIAREQPAGSARLGEPPPDLSTQIQRIESVQMGYITEAATILEKLEDAKPMVDKAVIEWVQGADAGERLTVPLSTVQDYNSKIHGWYSSIANEVEKLPEKVSLAEAKSRLSKAPGVKKDEWEWMGMDAILDRLYTPDTRDLEQRFLHYERELRDYKESDILNASEAQVRLRDQAQRAVEAAGGEVFRKGNEVTVIWGQTKPLKSVSRDDLVKAIRQNTFQFHTEHLTGDETYYETQYNVTLPGPKWDYAETLLYWPERLYPPSRELDFSDWEDMREAWDEHLREEHADEIGEDYDLENIRERYGSDVPDWFVEQWEINRQPQPLYAAPHFESRYDDYGDADPEGHNLNLLAHLRSSGRWVEGGPVRVIEETQSDIHEAAQKKRRVSGTDEKVRVGYRTDDLEQQYLDAQNRKGETQNAAVDATIDFNNAMEKAIKERDVEVRNLTTGDSAWIRRGEYGDPDNWDIVHEEPRRREDGTLSGYYTQPDVIRRDNAEPVDPELRDAFDKMRDALAERDEARRALGPIEVRWRNAAPNMPYKGERWEELLFREAVRQVVAEGGTKITWTTGAQQAERYNKLVGTNVNRLEWDGDTLTVFTPDGERRTFDTIADAEGDAEDKLIDLLGVGLAKKLAEQVKEPEHGVFRVHRMEDVPGQPYRQERVHMLRPEEFQHEDNVFAGAPVEHWHEPEGLQDVLSFNVRRRRDGELGLAPTGATRPEDRWLGEKLVEDEYGPTYDWIKVDDWAKKAEEHQRYLWEEWGAARREPAVLEGENISVGGGGFIDAYDRRMRNYAKKYLGTEPRRAPLDVLEFDTLFASDPRHPDYPAEAMERYHELAWNQPGENLTPGEIEARLAAHREEVVQPAMDRVVPIFRVKVGDTVLAESETLQAALQAAVRGGPDAGFWPPRIRYLPDEKKYAIVHQSGRPGAVKPAYERIGDRRFDHFDDAKEALDETYHSDWNDAFDRIGGERVARGKADVEYQAEEVWVADIPEQFAAQLHEKGSPLFQRRRGSVLGLARLTDEGADILIDEKLGDLATWVEEAAHAVIPSWFDDADARMDLRGDHIRTTYLDLDEGAAITNDANEVMAKVLQAWIHQGAMPAPQMRTLFAGLEDNLKQAYTEGIHQIALGDEKLERLINKMLGDTAVTSFLRDQFDVAPYKDFDPGSVAFSTTKRRGRVSRASDRGIMRAISSVLPSRRPKERPNTMKAWESGDFDVGPDVTAHYAAAQRRHQLQDEIALRVKRFDEPIEIVNGVPKLKDGYRVYNYHGVRGANERLDRMFRFSERYGDIADSEEPLLSADAATGGAIDMTPEDFGALVDDTTRRVLTEEMVYESLEKAAAVHGDRFVEMVREGLITQIPEDVAQAFIASSGGAYASGAISNIMRGVATLMLVPNMMARWRMIGKAAYPIVNVAATAILVGLHQGPALALSVRSVIGMSRATRIRLLEEVGMGVSDITDLPPIVGETKLDAFRRHEQALFRRAMTALSQPEAHVRLTQMDSDLAARGFRSEADVVRLLDLAREGDPQARAVLTQIGYLAEDAVVRFRGMSPEEQFVVRDAIFVYGWMRAATRFMLRFPLNRPLTANALANIGQMGWENLQDEFWALAREQEGALPIGQRKTAEGFLRKIVDLSQLFPFKTGVDVLRPFFGLMGLEEQGLRPASWADLLSPSAEAAIRLVYGQDPRYGTGFWDGIKSEFSLKNVPGVFWISRFHDPSLTGTKLRAPTDRWGVFTNFMLGMLAPQEIRESVSYERWLDQQPQEVRTVIREQNNATAFAQVAKAAADVGGYDLDSETVRAINAASAYKIYTDLYEHKNGSINAVQRAAAKGMILQRFYPEAYEDGIYGTQDLNVSDPDDAKEYQDVWGEIWQENVSDTNSATKQDIKDYLGTEVAERAVLPRSRKAIAEQWLLSAPPESIDRLKRLAQRRGWTMDDQDDFNRAVLDEMQRVSVP